MRRLLCVQLVCWLGLAIAPVVRAQTPSLSSSSQSTTAEPAPSPASSTQSAPTAPDRTINLFKPTWHQLQFGGRLTSVAGDKARFERYQDLRDGPLLTDSRDERVDSAGTWLFRGSADNVGWLNQRYIGYYERTGHVNIFGEWDEIPQYYSIDTKTPYLTSRSPLLLNDTTQRLIQNGQATLSAYVPTASSFPILEQRDVGTVGVLSTPTPHLDLKAGYQMTRHSGELPWGASFGFGNDVEVPLPYDSRTNNFAAGAEWTNSRSWFRIGYEGSWFKNLDDTLIWDSPLRLDDSPTAPGRGRMALWPSNSSQTASAAGYLKFAHRTQLTGLVSYDLRTNDEPLQPFTINSALPTLPLPRATAEAEARVMTTNLTLVSTPWTDWHFTAHQRRYDYDNTSEFTAIPQFINYDTSLADSATGGPERYAQRRTTYDAFATWTGIQPLALGVGYTRNDAGYDFRIFDNTGENVLDVTADALGWQWVTLRAHYQRADRHGSGFNEDLLVQIGEQPAMRHYDIANRKRNQLTGLVDIAPNEIWTFSGTFGVGKDNFDDSYFGLQDFTFRVFSVGVDYRRENGFGGGAMYNFERYAGLQRSRSASPGQETDPLRDWTADSVERVNFFSIYATPPRFARNTEAQLSFDYSYSRGDYLYTVVPGGPLPPPDQLPRVYNKLQQLNVDVRHRLTNRLALALSYLYEPFRVYDFAFDQTVVNSIVQPSSLVLGYIYRPYTGNSGVLSLRYLW